MELYRGTSTRKARCMAVERVRGKSPKFLPKTGQPTRLVSEPVAATTRSSLTKQTGPLPTRRWKRVQFVSTRPLPFLLLAGALAVSSVTPLLARELYTTGDQEISVVDTESGQEVRSFPVSADRIVAVNPLLYFTVRGTVFVRAIDLRTGTLVREFPLPQTVSGPLAAAPDGSALYVAVGFEPPAAIEIRTTSGSSEKEISVPTEILDLAAARSPLSPSDRGPTELYVLHRERTAAPVGANRWMVSVFNAATGTLLRVLPLPGSGSRIAVAGSVMYVSAAGTSTVLALDATSGEVLRRYPVTCCAEGPVAAAPDGSAFYVLTSEFFVPVVLEFDPRRPPDQTPRVLAVDRGTREIAVAVPNSQHAMGNGGCTAVPASSERGFPLAWLGFLLLVAPGVGRRRVASIGILTTTLALPGAKLTAACLAPGATLRIDEGPFQVLPPPSGTAPRPATGRSSSDNSLPGTQPGAAFDSQTVGAPRSSLLRAPIIAEIRKSWLAPFEADRRRMLDYTYALLCAVGAIFKRDVGVDLQVAHVQVWEAFEPYSVGSEPLFSVRDYWNANFPDCRIADLAEGLLACEVGGNGPCCLNRALVLSLRYGGGGGSAVLLKALCSRQAYAQAGTDPRGTFTDPNAPPFGDPTGWNLFVTGQEIGHLFGACHTDCSGPYDRPECGYGEPQIDHCSSQCALPPLLARLRVAPL